MSDEIAAEPVERWPHLDPSNHDAHRAFAMTGGSIGCPTGCCTPSVLLGELAALRAQLFGRLAEEAGRDPVVWEATKRLQDAYQQGRDAKAGSKLRAVSDLADEVLVILAGHGGTDD